MQIVGHLFLDYCWVCKKRFGPDTKKEDHHVIPRAYGGLDGPQVSLCDSHHTALHEIALKLYSKKSYYQLLTKDADVNKKLLYLASVVYNSRLATENDPNKKPLLIESVKKETLNELKQLRSVIPKSSRAKILEAAVHALHSRYFINRPK